MRLLQNIFSIVSIFIFFNFSLHANNLPDNNNNKTIDDKKSSFFEFIYPLVEHENILILRTREKVINIKNKLIDQQTISASEQTLLTVLARKYRLLNYKNDSKKLTEKLLIRIDVIPPSLALSQSANESAWGKSRFALKANNYYGQWCFKKGCGIIPDKRSATSRHEVKRFDSARESVRSYIKNINTTKSYSLLRSIRYTFRNNKLFPDGYQLAKGLSRYSSRGAAYVKEIRSMIKQNKLNKYDERFWNLIKSYKLNQSI